MPYPTTAGDAARLITDARSKISVNLPTYIGSEVHHVIPVSLIATGSGVTVAPGLTATAEIRTDQRRVIDYLLSPLERTLSEAARER